VVPPNTLSRRGRQRRARRFGFVLSTVLVVALFGVVGAHVGLAQQQFRLDALERDAANEETRYEKLRLEVAQLESPDRIVAAAQALGMVPPVAITYLTSTQSTPAGTRADKAPRGEWATVKSHLASKTP
jgi:cell division protein FtsL